MNLVLTPGGCAEAYSVRRMAEGTGTLLVEQCRGLPWAKKGSSPSVAAVGPLARGGKGRLAVSQPVSLEIPGDSADPPAGEPGQAEEAPEDDSSSSEELIVDTGISPRASSRLAAPVGDFVEEPSPARTTPGRKRTSPETISELEAQDRDSRSTPEPSGSSEALEEARGGG